MAKRPAASAAAKKPRAPRHAARGSGDARTKRPASGSRSATASRKSATAGRKSSTGGRKSATTGRKSATTGRKSATASRKSAATGRRGAANRKVRRTGSSMRVRSRRAPSRAARLVVVVIVGMVAIVGGWIAVRGAGRATARLMTTNPRFAIRRIAVTGAHGFGYDRVLAEAGVAEGDNLFAVHLDEIRARLEALPNVAGARVRRLMPDALAIELRERWPVARIDSEHGAMVAHDRVVLNPAPYERDFAMPPQPGRLPVVVGIPGGPFRPGETVDGEWIDPALQTLDYAATHRLGDLARIECIDVAARHGLTLYLDSGRTVLMRRDGVDGQLRRLEVIIDETVGKGRSVATVDLTSGRNVPVTLGAARTSAERTIQ